MSRLLDYQQLHMSIETVQETIKEILGHKLANDEIPTIEILKEYIRKINLWIEHATKARDWYQWCAYKKELEEAGLNVIASKIESEHVNPDTLFDSFFKTLFRSIANDKIATSPLLRTFEGAIFDETVSRYKELADEFQILSQKELYARLAANVPRVSDMTDNSSPLGFLKRNISNGGRGLSLRDLFDHIEPLLPRLCPCMLMSPMSVAQFLDLSKSKFDLVIFDEASQVPTSEAVGAIARGKSLIVVGDPKQMPPTNFFSLSGVNEEEAEIDDLDSILDDCQSLGMPSLQLNWHYRSRHESLIAFSNNEYYDGKLITFPSVDDQTTKVKFRYVAGVYDKGGKRSNQKEAETIVEDIVMRLSSPAHANSSIGVIAFSKVQQNLIEDLLMERLEKDKKLHEAAEKLYEPIFVKNLENVQGDERDIIMFSIGYGPDKNGKVSMNFGPLNNAGGEKRLNVAVSRARREMIVYSSLKSSQIDLRRSKSRGVEGLKHFLEYAESQLLANAAANEDRNFDSILAEKIAIALNKRGHVTKTNIGRSNFKIDIAIVDKVNSNNYALGILLDGKGYHNTQTTKDREIVQPAVLKMLGWKTMRVWSIDWLTNPERVIARIEKRLKENETKGVADKQLTFDISNESIDEYAYGAKAYEAYNGKVKKSMTYEQIAHAILLCEQPMTLRYLCRQITSQKNIPRVTPTLQAIIKEYAQNELYVQQYKNSTVLWTDKKHADTFEGYRKANGRKINEIPLVEVINAIYLTIKEQISIRIDALTLIVAKQFGFTRCGSKINQVLEEAFEALANQHLIDISDGIVKLHEK